MWREEGRSLPFIKDLFDAGCLDRNPQDAVIFTNSDTIARSDLALEVASRLQTTNACFSYRMDFHHPLKAPPADSEFSRGVLYPGSDLVAFRVGWWRTHRDEMPDMVLGFEAADPVLRTLVDATNPGRNNELVGVIAHERHASHWEQPHNRYRLRGQRHNLRLAAAFLSARGIAPAQFGIKIP